MLHAYAASVAAILSISVLILYLFYPQWFFQDLDGHFRWLFWWLLLRGNVRVSGDFSYFLYSWVYSTIHIISSAKRFFFSFYQVDQLVFEELVRERFPKLGLYTVIIHFHLLFWPSELLSLIVNFLYQFYFLCSQSSRLPGSAGSMGYWTMVPFHFYEHASLGKWSGFMLYLLNRVAYSYFIICVKNVHTSNHLLFFIS